MFFLSGLFLKVVLNEFMTCVGDTKSAKYYQLYTIIRAVRFTPELCSRGFLILLEAPESGEPKNASNDVEEDGSSHDTDVASTVEQPGTQREGYGSGEIPHETHHGQSDHSLPRGWVVSNEAVCHHDEGQGPPGDVLDRHDGGQPHPPVPLLQVNRVQKIGYSAQGFPRHAERQERLAGQWKVNTNIFRLTLSLPKRNHQKHRFCLPCPCLPPEAITPTPDVEWEQDGNEILCQGNDVVEADHLFLHCIVGLCLSVILDVGAEFHSQVELVLSSLDQLEKYHCRRFEWEGSWCSR